MDRSLPKHPSPFKDASGSMLLIALFLIMVVGGAGFFLWRGVHRGSFSVSTLTHPLSKSPDTTSSVASHTQDPSNDLQALDQDTSALEKDLNNVDSSLNDKQGDLSEQ